MKLHFGKPRNPGEVSFSRRFWAAGAVRQQWRHPLRWIFGIYTSRGFFGLVLTGPRDDNQEPSTDGV